MNTNEHFENVKEFMQVFGQRVLDEPVLPTSKLALLRMDLLNEEIDELEAALDNDDYIEIADAFTDILYVAYGAYAAFGLTPTLPEMKVQNIAEPCLPSIIVARHIVNELRLNMKHIDTHFTESFTDIHMKTVTHKLNNICEIAYISSMKMGIDIGACFNEVHASNMSKVCETYDDAVRSISARQTDTETASKYQNVYIDAVGKYFVIKRVDNNKVLKGLSYFEPNLVNILKL